MINLAQNVWEIYGLKGNPFDTRALSIVSETLLPISKAFVGRSPLTREFKVITNVLRNPGGACVVVEGEIGVGKTTFVNYHRFLWERESRDKLFTPLNEIGVTPEWSLKIFVMNILDALISKLASMPDANKIIKKSQVFQEIMILSKVYFGKNYQIEAGTTAGFMGFNLGLGKNEIISVPDVSETQLSYYFKQMVTEVKKLGYAGVFLHFDNLELIERKENGKMKNLFEELRDVLQTPDVYFVFVGYRGFFSRVIAPSERVRSIFFGYPIILAPLTQEQVLEAIEKRYQLLSFDKNFIAPVEESFIIYLYKVFKGKIRFIMDSMNTLIPNLNTVEPVKLNGREASKQLLQITFERLTFLTPKEQEILKYVALKDTFTNKQLCQYLDMPSANVSRILKKLQESNLIYINQQIGRYVHYRVSEEIRIIGKNFQRKSTSKHSETKFTEALLTFEGKKFTAQDYQEAIGMAPSTSRRYLKQFVDQGKIIKSGKGRSTNYQATI